LENRRDKNDEMLRKVWKTMKNSTEETRMGKTKERRSKERTGKRKKRDRAKKRKEKEKGER